MQSILIREPQLDDESRFLTAMQRSVEFHSPWTKTPITTQQFSEYIERYQQINQKSYLICDYEEHILVVFNIKRLTGLKKKVILFDILK